MEASMMQYPPGDPRMIDTIVYQLKSQGIFDQFRKECIADVDTKPAYQNLHQRVEGTVSSFLSQQVWRPELNKNQLRESLRKHIHESGFLDIGVERIVDQVVNPKIMTVLVPQVEDVVYKFIGIEKPKKSLESSYTLPPPTLNLSNLETPDKKKDVSLKDLLPKDLDPVSPESNESKKSDNSFEDGELNDGNDAEEDEVSPPFESIKKDEFLLSVSEDSNISGISGLTSPDGNHSNISFTDEKSKTTALENQLVKLPNSENVTKNLQPSDQEDESSNMKIDSVGDNSVDLVPANSSPLIHNELQSMTLKETTKSSEDSADVSSSDSSDSSSSDSSSTSSPGLGSMSDSKDSDNPIHEQMERVESATAIGAEKKGERQQLKSDELCIRNETETRLRDDCAAQKTDSKSKKPEDEGVVAKKEKCENRGEKLSRREREDASAKRDKEHKSQGQEKKVLVIEKAKHVKEVTSCTAVSSNADIRESDSLSASDSQDARKLKESGTAKRADKPKKFVKNGEKSDKGEEKPRNQHRDEKSATAAEKLEKSEKNGEKAMKKERSEHISVKSEHKEKPLIKKEEQLEKKNESKKEDKHSSDSNHSSGESHSHQRRSSHSSHRTDKDRHHSSSKSKKHDDADKSRVRDDKKHKDDKSKSTDKHKSSGEKEVREKSKSSDKSSTTKDKDTKRTVEKDSLSKSSTDRERKDSKSKISDSKAKESSMKKKEKGKLVDDHSKHREKKQSDDRRSTDRDSNGTARDRSASTSHSTLANTKDSQRKETKSGSSGGKSSSSGNTDRKESAHGSKSHSVKHSASKKTTLETKEEYFCSTTQEGQLTLKIKKPKIAANIFEVQKIINMRKSLAKLEQQRQQELSKVQSETEKSAKELATANLNTSMEQSKKDVESDSEDVRYLEPAVYETHQRFIQYVERLGRSRTLSELSIDSINSNDLSYDSDEEPQELPLVSLPVQSSNLEEQHNEDKTLKTTIVPPPETPEAIDSSIASLGGIEPTKPSFITNNIDANALALSLVTCPGNITHNAINHIENTIDQKAETASVTSVGSTEMKPPENSPSLNDKRETRRSRKPNMKYSRDDYSFEEYDVKELEKKVLKRPAYDVGKANPLKKQKTNHFLVSPQECQPGIPEDNNNKNDEQAPVSNNSTEVPPAKVLRLGPGLRIGLSRLKTRTSGGDVARVTTPDFVMPLSPESDVSASSGDLAKKTVLGPSPSTSEEDAPSVLANSEARKNQRRTVTPANKAQRYSSDDLYKPRPLFSRMTRRNRPNATDVQAPAENLADTQISLKRQR